MSRFGLRHEPMPQESVQAGAAVVTFSGDKLLGGPQAGIMAGQRAYRPVPAAPLNIWRRGCVARPCR